MQVDQASHPHPFQSLYLVVFRDARLTTWPFKRQTAKGECCAPAPRSYRNPHEPSPSAFAYANHVCSAATQGDQLDSHVRQAIVYMYLCIVSMSETFPGVCSSTVHLRSCSPITVDPSALRICHKRRISISSKRQLTNTQTTLDQSNI